ncbi:DUF6491 family protein [Brevundimonas goettingensis]|uniref:Secreted protein n=1 Tax=Brevundimonas goettingensis TaxID=2774190 RepID=A0A975BZ07_9CAUL|nr:DUF6491 family protein [Brevundimonas goettingensis]QTC90388.1 hypothetical protein IFJ75_14030 [Brevundimonas goettingensis]
MRQSLLLLVPAVGLMVGSAALPAAAPARAEAPERQCFSQQQVDNFRSGRDQTLYLKVRGSGVYQLTTAGACLDLDHAYQMAIVPEMGASRLCTDEWATLAVPGSAAPVQACRARIDKKLTDAEVAALPARSRP